MKSLFLLLFGVLFLVPGVGRVDDETKSDDKSPPQRRTPPSRQSRTLLITKAKTLIPFGTNSTCICPREKDFPVLLFVHGAPGRAAEEPYASW